MNFFNLVRNFLQEPKLKGIDYNSSKLISVHRQILFNKKMIQEVFKEFYDKVIALDKKYLSQSENLSKIEIGSGSSFLKLYYKNVVTSDIKKSDLVEITLDAQNMNLEKESVSAFYAINCFHHFPNPELFFHELNRVLIKGGGCIIVEPYYGPFANFFYKRVFDIEFFDKNQPGWITLANAGPSKGANQALSYIVFIRDLHLFKDKFPSLEIVYESRMQNYLRYLLSGGLNFRQLLPNFFLPFLKFLEILLIPVSHLFALHYVLVIRKK